MIDTNTNDLSKSYLKKLERKQKRAQIKISEELKIKCTNIPTSNILICNVGLVNGFTQEKCITLFLSFGNIKQVIMIPKKSYCFVIFETLEDSSNAYRSVHGKINMGQNNNPLFLSFTEAVPEISSEWRRDFPTGLILYQNFISESEENVLLSCLDWTESTVPKEQLKQRQVKHFGYEFRYDRNNVDRDSPLSTKLPIECLFITDRLSERGFNKVFIPDQLTVNMYQPGQGIPPHVDTHSAFEDPILSLSLGSSVVMDFKHRNGAHIPVVLPRRSLLVMSEAARYDWTHGIAARMMDTVPAEKGLTVQNRDVRVSFTFRKVLRGGCQCSYIDECDSAKNRLNQLKIENNFAIELEKNHVHQVYDAIATHFSDTRHKPWPNVLDFVLSFDIGSILVDVGCGNGKYLGRNKNVFDIGCDRSASLLDVCTQRSYHVFQCDCLYLPLRSNIADGCICIAVIHHLANEERRLQAISEMLRILKPGGKALIYVWAKDQTKNNEKSSYLKQDRKNRRKNSEKLSVKNNDQNQYENMPLPVHTNRTEFKHKDMLVPWKTKQHEQMENKTFLRFYHIFDENELETLCLKLSNCRVVKSYYDEGNWCVILEKIQIL